MAIPAQVQAQADRADELIKGLPGNTEKIPEEANAGQTEDPNKKIVAVVEDTVEGLKHKLAVLQGKYNSEIEPIKKDVNLLNNLKKQVRTLSGQLQEQNALIVDLQKKLTEKPKEVPAVVVDDTDPMALLPAEDREYLKEEGFTDRFIGIVGKVAKGLAKKEQPVAITTGKAEIEEIRRTVQQGREETFWLEFKKGVPNWEQINGNDEGAPIMPEFDAWLDGRIPYSSKTRRMALQDAQNNLDFTTAIQVFQDFIQGNPELFIPKKEATVVDLNTQIEPSSSVAHTDHTTITQVGKTYTAAEVKGFYDDTTKGKWKGKEKEWAAIDADITKANYEGRITN